MVSLPERTKWAFEQTGRSMPGDRRVSAMGSGVCHAHRLPPAPCPLPPAFQGLHDTVGALNRSPAWQFG
jgi:hypothetical protein